MARTDYCFNRLRMDYRSCVGEWYLRNLFETKKGYEGKPHVLWGHMYTDRGYPGHKMYGKIMPLSGYLLYKNDNFQLAPDEVVVTVCGIRTCCQTAHMSIVQRAALVAAEP